MTLSRAICVTTAAKQCINNGSGVVHHNEMVASVPLQERNMSGHDSSSSSESDGESGDVHVPRRHRTGDAIVVMHRMATSLDSVGCQARCFQLSVAQA